MSDFDPELIVPLNAKVAEIDLAQTLGTLEDTYAVIDGAFWPELPMTLQQAGVFARSLFVGAGRDVELAGPWLAAMPGSGERKAVLSVVGVQPAAVFWSWADGEASLWKHLRSLQQVQIPAVEATTGRATETVLFRHWDPRVMTLMLPLLRGEQIARVFGRARAIVARASDGVVHRAAFDPTEAATPRGMLRLSAEQMTGLQARMLERSHRRIARYLREVLPDGGSGRSDAELHRLVTLSDVTGRGYGLQSEQAHGRWAYLMTITDLKIATMPEVRSFMAEPGADPDTQVRRLMLAGMMAANAKAG